MVKLHNFYTTLTIIAVTGCSLAPEYHRPVSPVASVITSESSEKAIAVESGINIDWSQYFDDDQLKALIKYALANSRNLRIALLQVDAARAFYGIQRANQYPNIGIAGQGSRSRIPADLSITGRPEISSQYQATLYLSAWELDFWGRVRNLKDSALETFLASEEARRAYQLSLIGLVANSYLTAREMDERLGKAKLSLSTRQASLRIMRRRYEVGSASKLEAAQAEVLFHQAQSEIAVLERQREQNHNALNLLVGGSISRQERPLSEIEDGFAKSVPSRLSSEVLLQRPDVLAAEHRLKAANANIGVARAAFFPRITLTGNAGTASSELNGLFDAGSHAWSFVPNLSLPIFDAGRNRANLELAEARRNEAIADYERTIQGAFREVADSLADQHWVARQVEVQRASVDTHSERARLAHLRYQSGTTSFLDVLDAERDLFNAEQSLIQSRRTLLTSAVNLYVALGGGEEPDEMYVRTDLRAKEEK